MKMSISQDIKIILMMLALSVLLIGCATQQPQFSEAATRQQTGTGVAIKPSEVGRAMTPSVEYIRVKMERSIFLDPPEGNTDTYLRVRDTSGRNWGLELERVIGQQMRQQGFNVVKNAKDAAYSLQVNVLFADEASAAEIAKLDETQYGQSISGIVGSSLIGAGVGGLGGNIIDDGGLGGVAVGAVVGGVAGGLLNIQRERERTKMLQSKQETKFFSFIADIEVRERIKGDSKVKRKSRTRAKSTQHGESRADLADHRDSGAETISRSETETFEDETTWKRQRTRLVGKAKGKLVVFEDVQSDFAVKMAKALGGLF